MRVPISGDVHVRRASAPGESSMSCGIALRKGKAAYDAGMAARGPYAKGVAKRAEILDTALAVIDEHGYTGATVKELADAVGLSQNGLLHYFGSKDSLFVEVVRHHEAAHRPSEIDRRAHGLRSADFAGRLQRAAADSIKRPGMSSLFLNLATAANASAHPAHQYMLDWYVSFRSIATSVLTELQARGEFPAQGDPAAAAALLVAALDGLQLQWLYDPSIDVEVGSPTGPTSS
jgi:AcrR family transcriptional regulator